MKRRLNKCFLLLSAAVGLLEVWARADGPRYRVTDLSAHFQPVAINDSGEVVGDQLLPDGKYHAFLFSKGRLHDLGTLGGPNSSAVGITADGVVVGNSDETEEMLGPSRQRRRSPFVYKNGRMRPLRLSGESTFPGSCTVCDVNDQGQFAIELKFQQAAILSNGVIVRLGTFVPKGVGFQIGWSIASDGTRTPEISYHEGYTIPRRINSSGEIIGTAATRDGESAFLYSKGVLQKLDGMGASDINAASVIVGAFRAQDGSRHACLYTQGKITDLGIPPGFKDGSAEGINDAGEIVENGTTVTGSGFLSVGVYSRPFLYAGGHWIDLTDRVDFGGTMLKSLYDATRINARGQIIGKAVGQSGIHGYLLTPVDLAASN